MIQLVTDYSLSIILMGFKLVGNLISIELM
jgi:hypothetical protein